MKNRPAQATNSAGAARSSKAAQPSRTGGSFTAIGWCLQGKSTQALRRPPERRLRAETTQAPHLRRAPRTRACQRAPGRSATAPVAKAQPAAASPGAGVTLEAPPPHPSDRGLPSTTASPATASAVTWCETGGGGASTFPAAALATVRLGLYGGCLGLFRRPPQAPSAISGESSLTDVCRLLTYELGNLRN